MIFRILLIAVECKGKQGFSRDMLERCLGKREYGVYD
jgi:hypothetical protein